MKLSSVKWPRAVDGYLDALVEAAPQSPRTSRATVLAALVCTTSADQATVEKLLNRFGQVDTDALPVGERRKPALGRPRTTEPK